MDEYYCPNCNATLNDQPGFDPDNGTWTCTECGQHLMDESVYEGDTYEGIAWYCDNCNALLNKQDGFSDSYGSWICTECGHVNGTTEDDIIDDEEKKFSCPYCYSALNDQLFFSASEYDWTCTSCGKHLHHSWSDDDYSVVEDEDEEKQLKCPSCGAILNKQFLFSKDDRWTCTECRDKLKWNWVGDEYEAVESNDELEEYDDCFGDEEIATDRTQGSFDMDSACRSFTNPFEKKRTSSIFSCPCCGDVLGRQSGFNAENEQYICTSCHTTLAHEYTDEPYRIVRVKAKTSKTTAHTSNASSSTPRKTSSTVTKPYSVGNTNAGARTNYTSKPHKKSQTNDWIVFFTCLFLGYAGIHKFIDGKIALGILYLLTGGLFYIGWAIDTISLFLKAIK